jgi:hypothetical protein
MLLRITGSNMCSRRAAQSCLGAIGGSLHAALLQALAGDSSPPGRDEQGYEIHVLIAVVAFQDPFLFSSRTR